MKFSYLGMEEPMREVNASLMTHIRACRREYPTMPPLTPDGVFASDIQKAASFAVQNEMAVYTSALDMIKNADVIFCFLSESALRSFADDMSSRGITGKIFCHFCPAFNADVLRFDARNTYASFFIPLYQKLPDGTLKAEHVFVEGFGPRYDEVHFVARLLGITLTAIDKESKLIYLTAANFLNDFKKHIEDSAQKLMRVALYNDPALADEIFQKCNLPDYMLSSYDAIASANLRFVHSQSDMFAALGLNDVSSLFGALLLAKSKSVPKDFSKASHIAEAAHRLIK